MNEEMHELYLDLMEPYSKQAEQLPEYKAGQKLDSYLEKAAEHLPEAASEAIGFTALTSLYFPAAMVRGANDNIEKGLEDIKARLEPGEDLVEPSEEYTDFGSDD